MVLATNKNKYNKIRKNKDILEGECKFPFKFKGKLYNECIEGKEGKWCATQVNDRRYTKKWGFCPNEVEIKQNSEKNKTNKKNKNNNKKEEIVEIDNIYVNYQSNEPILYQSQNELNKFLLLNKEEDKYIIYYLQNDDINDYLVKNIKKYTRKSSIDKILKDEFQRNNYIPYGISSIQIMNKVKDKPYRIKINLIDNATLDDITKYIQFITTEKQTKHKKTQKKNNKLQLTPKKSSSSQKKSSSNKIVIDEFNREKTIKELKERCIDEYDGITFEEFEDWEDDELKTAIMIGPPNNKRCYKLDNIYKWVEQLIKDDKPLKDPINIAHEITEEELNLMKEMKKKELGDKYVSPKHKKIVLDTQNVELVISNPDETLIKIPYHYVRYHPYKYNFLYPFYHIEIKINIPSTTNTPHRIKKIDLGYIPAGVEPLPGEDSYLSSYSVIASIIKLWDMRKLLTVHHPLNNIDCCTVELNKNPEYWFQNNGSGRIDRTKLSKMGEDLRYQELM